MFRSYIAIAGHLIVLILESHANAGATHILMKGTKLQTHGAPMCVRSLAHNNYLLLGVVTQHVESRSIREVQKDGLE